MVAAAPGSRKETHFFDSLCGTASKSGINSEYHSYFPRPEGKLVGEWTPRYMHDFWVPPLLKLAAPHARLLVLIRDPVDRYWSGLSHEHTKGTLPDRLLLASDTFSRGLYWQQLDRLLRTFDRRQVLVLQYECCTADPRGCLRETQAFLGLEERPPPPVVGRRVNETEPGGPKLPDELRESLREAYVDDSRRLLALFPKLDGELWPHMRDVL